MTEPTSAVVVRIHVPPGLARIRRCRDHAASLGVSPHVTGRNGRTAAWTSSSGPSDQARWRTRWPLPFRP